jgi:hypothetical protein
MKKLSLAVAMLAAASMVVAPVAPSFASEAGESAALRYVAPQAMTSKQVHQRIVAHAQRGEAAILSKSQLDRLAATHPKLHAKLMMAYNTGTVPSLTAKEKKMLTAQTQANLEQYKAGNPAAVHLGTAAVLSGGAWFVIGFLGVVAFLLFLYFFTPNLFRRHAV